MASINDLTLSNIMSEQVHALHPNNSLNDALKLMAEQHVSCLAVMQDNQPVGILTEQDMLKLFTANTSLETPVSQVMSTPAVSAPANLNFRSAYQLMTRHRIRHLIVLGEETGQPGIVTESDFRAHLGLELFLKTQDLRSALDVGFASLPHSATLAETIRHMAEGKWDSVIAMHQNQAVGILTERDIPRLLACHSDPDTIFLQDVMSSPVTSISVTASLADAANLMSRDHIRHMVVTDEQQQVIGVLSQHLLLEHLGGVIIEQAWEDRLSAELAQKHDHLLLEMEHEFAILLSDEPDREVILQAMLDAALRLPELDGGAILEVKADGGCRLVQQRNLPAYLIELITDLKPGSLEAQAIQRGQFLCSGVTKHPLCSQSPLFSSQAATAAGIRSIALLPLSTEGKCNTCLYLTSKQVESLSADTINAFDTLTRQFSQALDKLTAIEQVRQRQEALIQSETFLRTVFRTIPDLIWLKDTEGTFLACNQTFERLLGASESEIIGKTDYDFVDREAADMFRANDRKAAQAGHSKVNEEWLKFAKDGYEGLFETIKTPMYDDQGELIGVLGLARDISDHRRAELALQALNRDFISLLENTTDFIYHKDADSRFRFCSQTLAEITGHASWRDMIGKHNLEVFPAETAKIYQEEEALVFKEGTPLLNKINPYYDQQGRKRWISTNKWPVKDDQDEVIGLFGISRDITDQLATAEALKESEEMLRTLINAMPDIVCFKDGEGRWLLANDFDLKLFQLEGVDYVGKKDSDLASFSSFYREAFMGCEESDEEAWALGSASRGDETIPRPDGPDMVFDVIKIPTFHQDGTRKGLVVVGRDVTERKLAENQLKHLAHYDPLTHLPNRMLLSDRLKIAAAQSQRNGKLLAVCYLDLDGFKPVNDRFGHDTGDRLLAEVGHRLSESMRAGDSVGRLGGDEFVLLFGDLESENECCSALERTLKALANPYYIDAQPLLLTASIGVTIYPTDLTDSDTLLRHADQAMYEAKQAGRNRYHFFDPNRDQRMRIAQEEQSRIQQGLDKGEMVLFYQPKVNMRRGEVYGAEALIRWRHPELGMVMPLEFLPKIAESIIAVEIDFWVLEQALQQLQAWHSKNLLLSISVNISARTLGHSDFLTRLTELLTRFPTRVANTLEIEILESVALDDISRVSTIMEKCRKLNIGFALDDFGTGYSSLLYLRHLPTNILKIDQSFVRNMLHDPDDLTIIEGILGLADAFQCEAIAEGVEGEDHGVLLLQLGCNLAQGYGIAKPMPAEKIPAWIAGYRQPERWRYFSEISGPHPDAPLVIMSMEHKRWVDQLITKIENEAIQECSFPSHQLQSRECRFGRWYYGPGKHRFGQTPSFLEMEEIHERIHKLAIEAAGLCSSGRRPEAKNLIPSILQTRDELLSCLERLRQA